ncbi:putative membrane protein [Conyzicola lurida]|uniref:Putative membrane protein n=1 Tax=Conyzicola lurida TaxID=1172621 RepID=A0A841APT8_9MICO|nr:putative membrane protein [Conyzicola lurida]
MNHTVAGIFIGAVLALTWIVFGFWAFVFVAAAMAVGALVARVLDGKLDLRSVADAVRGKRSSS